MERVKKDMGKTIMIVGAGFGQVPAIERAKEMGLTVVTIDKNPDAIGMKLADYAYDVDILDEKGALAIAKKHDIDGIMTMQTDLPIPIVGYIVDQLGLKGSGKDVAERCSNKIFARQAFAKKNVPQPAFAVITNTEEAIEAIKEIGYPCVIKAPDSSGSRGVSKVSKESDIPAAVDEAFKYSRVDEVLIEGFVTGLEIGAQAFSVNGECKKVLVHNDSVASPPYMVPTGHSFPIKLNAADERAIEKAVATAVDALGITDGPSNIDFILDENNRPQILEIGARIGATCLPELVYYYTGIDWVKQSLKIALGEEVDLKNVYTEPIAALIMEAPKDGILKGYQLGEEVETHPMVKEVEITAAIGEDVNILRKGTDRIGKILVRGKNVEEAESLALSLRSKIKFEIV